MEGDKKRGARGWWALAGIGIPTLLLGLYVGSYYAMARPGGVGWMHGNFYDDYGLESYSWQLHSFTRSLFWPMHQIDRRLRPGFWGDRR